jgi:hypothetical protein
MMFWDSSAIAPLLVEESYTGSVRKILAKSSTMIVWVLTPVEVTSALWRRVHEGALDERAVGEALDGLSEIEQAWNTVVDVDQVEKRARRLLAVHALRAADSLQLAAALLASDERPSGQPFVTLDRQLADIARREGFRILPE